MQIHARNRTKHRELIIMCGIIMLTDTILFAKQNDTTMWNLSKAIIILATIIQIVLAISRNVNASKTNENVLILALSLMAVVLSGIANGDALSATLLKCCLPIIGYIYCRRHTLEEFSQMYIKVMLVIAVVSIITFVFGEAISQLSFIPSLISETGKAYKCLFFSNVCLSALDRNFGPFWEPGAYQAYLIIALLLRCYGMNTRQNLFRDIAIFSIALITTFSTTGIIVMLLCFICIVTANKNISKRAQFMISILCVGVGVFVLVDEYTYNLIFGKLYEGMDRASVRARIYSNVGLAQLFLKNPVFGAGLSNTANELAGMFAERVSVTNTLLVNFAEFGFVYGIAQVVLVVKFAKQLMQGNPKWKVWLCVLILIVTMLGENFVLSLMFNTCFFLRREKKQIA